MFTRLLLLFIVDSFSLAPTPPTNVQLTTPTATTLTLTWNIPNMTNGAICSYDYTCSSTTLQIIVEENNVSSSADRSVLLKDLTPFTEYQCSITASTSVGSSEPGTATGVTAQAGNEVE